MKIEAFVTKEMYTKCALNNGLIDDFDNPVNIALKRAFRLEGSFCVWMCQDGFHINLNPVDNVLLPLGPTVMKWLSDWRRWKRSWLWWKKLPELRIVCNMPNHQWNGNIVRRIQKKV